MWSSDSSDSVSQHVVGLKVMINPKAEDAEIEKTKHWMQQNE